MIILRLMDRVVQFTIRCAHFPQRVHGNLRGFDILVVIIDMHGHTKDHTKEEREHIEKIDVQR